MGDVTKLPGVDNGPDAWVEGKAVVNADTVLKGAIDHGLTNVVVLGWDDRNMLFAASTEPKMGDILMLMEFFKHKYMAGDYEQA